MPWRRSSHAANNPAGPVPTIRMVGSGAGASIGKAPSLRRSRLRAQRALRVDIDSIERGLRGDEQPVALAPAEADVGDNLRDRNRAYVGSVRRVTVHAAERRGPHIAVGVAAEAVVGSLTLGREGARIGDGVVALHVVGRDRARMPGDMARAGVADVQNLFVG